MLLVFLSACTTIRHVPEDELLLKANNVYIDSVKTNARKINELLLQRPNAKSLGLPLSLYFYNLGNPKGPEEVNDWKIKFPKFYNTAKYLFSEKQSISVAETNIGLNQWFLTNGEPPIIIQDKKINATTNNLQKYYFTEGYFRAKTSSAKKTISDKKGLVNYYVSKGEPSYLDTVYMSIKSPVLDSIHKNHATVTYLKKGEQYKNINFIKETKRLINLYRNKGIYHFTENNISYNNDTLNNYRKTNVEIAISDRLIEKNKIYEEKPFKVQKIKKINIFTDYLQDSEKNYANDTTKYKGINYISNTSLKYNPKYLSQSIFIKPNQVYSDSLRNLTRNHLRGLKNFKTTSIRFNELNDDELEANITLTPIEKYKLGVETELSRSNIRNFDVSTEFSIANKNTFKGAEIFKLSILGSYFNADAGQPGYEIGGNLSIEIPRFMMPLGLSDFVPKRMFPKTTFYTGISIQKNIALDKQNISLGVEYKWNHDNRKTIQLELLNVQYIKNLNVNNYFNIYNSEYLDLLEIEETYSNVNNTATTLNNDSEQESSSNIVTLLNTIASDNDFQETNNKEFQENLNILSRYNIITSNFLIPEIAYNYTYNTQKNINDVDFSYFKVRVANSGTIFGVLSESKNSNGKTTLLNLPLAQYFKTDIEYKKFWKLGNDAVLAHRSFLGAIVTYNDSDIPFSKSYFAGGSNDIRAWKTYDLGPGTRPQGLEYNIGSLKLTSSLEYRFNLIGSLKSALFIDAGNIWDVTNSLSVDDESRFTGVKNLTDLAVAGGFGLRYDLKFLVVRLDFGFKMREPYLTKNKWFQEPNFANAIFNIGINYPF